MDILQEIKDNGLRANFVIRKLSMSSRTFYKRCKRNDWSDKEISILKELRLCTT